MTTTAHNDQPAGPEGFYVTVKDAGRTGYLLGPYATKGDAESDVPAGRELAERVCGRAAWYAYGVTRVVMAPGGVLPPGRLNALAAGPAPQPLVTAYRHGAS